MKAATSICLFLLLSSLCFPGGEARAAAADCGYVAKEALPCIPYVTGKQPRPAPACCAGLQQLARGAATTADRRAVCQCLETAARAFPGVQDRYFSRAPALCGVNVGFPVSLSTDCSKIN